MVRCAAAVGSALLVAFTLAGCSSTGKLAPDPLVERIFVSRSGDEIAKEELYDRMAKADVVFLGEIHDNADHHRHQEEVIEAMIARGLKPAVGFELFAREQTSILMNFSTPSQHHAASLEVAEKDLRARLGWAGRDDAWWAFYEPILALIRSHSLVVFGADLPAGLRNRVATAGIDGLSGVEKRLLLPSDLEEENYRHLIYNEFKEGHCGFGPEPYLRKLYDAWLARNEVMADSIAAILNDGVRPVIFLTGAAHTRYRMGVLERVAHRMPGVRQVDVGFTVVDPDAQPLSHYTRSTSFEGHDYGPDHEYVWLTDRYRPLDPDPCAPFRKRTAGQKQEQSGDSP